MAGPTTPEISAGVLELLRLFRNDEAAADRYASDCLERAKALEPELKAFEYLPVDTARRPGPLSGIAVAIKDIIATSDMPTTNGSPVYKDHVPAADAWVVGRLRQLGATIFGKTVSTEFAWRHPGPTVNPWNGNHTPGGSSSGSAAAVAAGIVPLALGTQTLGSVIRPAAFNGVVGLKPSFGAIPRIGVHPLSPSLDHVGFFARRVDDVALALSLLAGSSDGDPHGRPLPAFQVDIDTGLKPLDKPRLAIVRFEKWSRAEVEQQKAFEAAIEKLRDAGAVVGQLELSGLDRANWKAISHSRQRSRDHPRRSRRALPRPHQRSSQIAGGKRQGRFSHRLPRGEGAAGAMAQRAQRGSIRLRRDPDIAGIRRGAARAALHRRCRILRAVDPARRACGDASDRVWQKRPAARSSTGHGVQARPFPAPGRKMDRGCPEL
jgi:Asp-tRNA(Asn)/Glu-tRNA(Gln) amidotransferase A subunit family amidase